jgi:hypothetical protein
MTPARLTLPLALLAIAACPAAASGAAPAVSGQILVGPPLHGDGRINAEKALAAIPSLVD